jgi:uncharacterized membrane protein/thiol-disulfide isomerase/thioredoxin
VRKLIWKFIILLIISWLLIPSAAIAQSPGDPVVRAVLFYSPTCPHCHSVITEVLIPMVENYGSDQLQIIGLDTSQPAGGQLYQATIERYEIPSHRTGVPTLVIDDVVLVGSLEIPEMFPDLVEKGLEEGGIDWPDIPGLEQAIPPEYQEEATPATEPQPAATPSEPPTTMPTATQASPPTATLLPTQPPTSTVKSTPLALSLSEEEIPQPEADPVGFTLAGAVLLSMVVAMAYVAWRLITAWPRVLEIDRNPPNIAPTWAISILALLGLGVAAYLAYVEITQIEAVCGPVGECNIVQSSSYARILGIPIAVLGLLNYLAIVVLWAGQKLLNSRWANLSALGLLALTLFGTLFSIYLTCLELFVIHAICAWCLSSAVITTLSMLLSAIPITGRASLKLQA